MLDIRQLIESDYDTLCKWWITWGFEPVPRDFLPRNATGGLLVSEDGIPIVAAFIYNTDSAICWIDWVVSNKEYRKKPQRKQAIEILINSLTNIAKEAGYTYAYALIKNDKLVNIYEGLGYTKGISYNQELIKKL